MGDVLHALPAVSALRQAQPLAELAWAIEPKWMPLLEGSGVVDHILPLNRRDALSVWTAWRWLRRWQPDLSFDFQGLIKSALVSWLSGASRRIGFAEGLREEAAGVFYQEARPGGAGHVIDRNGRLLGLAPVAPYLPQGFPDGALPDGPFVLAAPLAGWTSKQWPLDRYGEIHRRLATRGYTLVLNVAPGQATPEGPWRHESSIAGLIDATRRASAVLGLDSGPLHLAAALRKPGVALFGPTDPARNGPYGGTIRTLRTPGAETTYQRGASISQSMAALDVNQVWAALVECLP